MERRAAVFDPFFWVTLTESQRVCFLAEADWQEIRHVPEARASWLERLLSLEEICERLGIDAVSVFWLMSTRKLPGVLRDGEWFFDPVQIDAYVADYGAPAALQRDVAAQIEYHRGARQTARAS
jgi:hypothetical protein